MDMFHFQELTRPQILHAITVHFPIVMALAGIPLVYLAAVTSNERSPLLWLAIVVYGVFAITAFVAAEFGERAAQLIPPEASPEVSDLLQRHERMLEKAWVGGALLVLVLVLSLIRIKALRAFFLIVAMIGSVALGGWLAIGAHYGGIMVYTHGVGTPYMTAKKVEHAVPPPPASQQQTDISSESSSELIPIRPIDPQAAAEVSYKRDIKPLFERYCVECHGESAPKGGLALTSVDAMRLSGKKAGPGVIPGKPDESSIVKYIRGELRPRMPKGQPPLSAIDLHVIRAWIAAGAVDDSKSVNPEGEISQEAETSGENNP